MKESAMQTDRVMVASWSSKGDEYQLVSYLVSPGPIFLGPIFPASVPDEQCIRSMCEVHGDILSSSAP